MNEHVEEATAKSGTMELTLEFPLMRISDLLCCAFEGGSNSWYMIEEFHAPTGKPVAWDFLTDRKDPPRPDTVIYKHLDYPLNPGGALIITSKEEPDLPHMKLDLTSIQSGLQVFATEYPRHFGDWLAENEDATTGDVFLQCCLFGKLVYG